MKLLLLALLVLCGTGCTDDTAIVFVCDSHHSNNYHLRADCRGLSDCSHRLTQITLKDARRSKKILCTWENK
ncbi:hypothetical protein Mucpa_1742 [Mucilaginibacter paludis DSM 18603]|uniref:Lipoprotein n=1 Tax=Mucilaginibacter paludis DSM 18603 TaxID=714943 RepID=H1Y8H8_9SPHI|nr:hypothetical protein Mucpa_1742 [Mucilaginibacter paludis DSM 18603]